MDLGIAFDKHRGSWAVFLPSLSASFNGCILRGGKIVAFKKSKVRHIFFANAPSSSSASITATASSSDLPRGSVASPLFATHPIYIYGLGLGCDDHDDEESDAEKDIDDHQGIMDNYDEDFGISPQLTNPTAISISRVITFAQSKKNSARSRF